MTCIRIPNGFVCRSPQFRLPLANGGRVFMEWHNYCGPHFTHDKAGDREVESWWENELIIDALTWFQKRGNRA